MERRTRPPAAAALVAAVILTLSAAPATAADPCHDPGSGSYSTHECKIARLRERPFVVIATVDTGINPYHEDFRLSADEDLQGVHPSEFIEGYPPGAPALDLSFDAASVAAARSQDAQEWGAVRDGKLAWIPGTNIIGGYAPNGEFFDTNGHGTGVSSIAGGRLYGRGGPNVLLVGVNGSYRGWQWAADQPWIDLISISWSSLIPILDQSAEASRGAVESGKINCVATGNLTVPIWFFEAQGPSWNVNVGAVDSNGQLHDYSGSPADVVAFPDLTVGTHTSMSETRTFGGTSGATPHTCALIARTLSAARERLSDFTEGPESGALAVGPAGGGALADGLLKRTEIEDALQSSATQVSGTAPWVRAGYGIVSADTVQPALEVIFGERPRPDRPEEDLWIETTDAARNAVYGQPPD